MVLSSNLAGGCGHDGMLLAAVCGVTGQVELLLLP